MNSGGQPQRVLVSQGQVRPGVIQLQCWAWRTWEQLPEQYRLPYVVREGICTAIRADEARPPAYVRTYADTRLDYRLRR